MSEESKGGGFFNFIWKCMITFLMFYGIAYALGYDQKLLEFIKGNVIPEFQNTMKPIAAKAKVIAADAVEIAKEKGGEALEIGKKAARDAASDLGEKARKAIDEAKNDISAKLSNSHD